MICKHVMTRTPIFRQARCLGCASDDGLPRHVAVNFHYLYVPVPYYLGYHTDNIITCGLCFQQEVVDSYKNNGSRHEETRPFPPCRFWVVDATFRVDMLLDPFRASSTIPSIRSCNTLATKCCNIDKTKISRHASLTSSATLPVN